MERSVFNALPEDVLIDGDFKTREVHIFGMLLRPEASLKVRNHSPDGHNWGYAGSGPAQLSLSILLRYLPKEEAEKYYQDFKFAVVSGWPQSDFEVHVNLKVEIKKILDKRGIAIV